MLRVGCLHVHPPPLGLAQSYNGKTLRATVERLEASKARACLRQASGIIGLILLFDIHAEIHTKPYRKPIGAAGAEENLEYK